MQKEPFARTLFDMKDQLQWVRQLGWTDDDLRSVPVHSEPTSGEERINLANFGGTSLGVETDLGSPTSADSRSDLNLWVFKRDVPDNLWQSISQLVSQKVEPTELENMQAEETMQPKDQ
jgi:hypothetical protein